MHVKDKTGNTQGRLASPRKFRHREKGAEMLELALSLPFLLIMLVGIIDFGAAWATQDKLANATRDGARVAVAEFNDTDNPQCPGVPCSVQAAANTVIESLNSANVNTCGLTDATTTAPAPGAFTWTYTVTCANPYTITVERAVPQAITSPTNQTVLCTRVTLVYTYNWNFANVIPLLGVGPSSIVNTFNLQSQAIMVNSN